MPDKKSSSCSSCGAPIRWARTIHGGKIPLDAEPAADGNIRLYGEGSGRDPMAAVLRDVVGPGQGSLLEPDVPLYKTHFATCPEAEYHRKKKEKEKA